MNGQAGPQGKTTMMLLGSQLINEGGSHHAAPQHNDIHSRSGNTADALGLTLPPVQSVKGLLSTKSSSRE